MDKIKDGYKVNLPFSITMYGKYVHTCCRIICTTDNISPIFKQTEWMSFDCDNFTIHIVGLHDACMSVIHSVLVYFAT